MADAFSIKTAPAPVAEPTRDACKFRRLCFYGTDEGKGLDRIEINLIDYDSSDPKEENTVGKSVTLELYDSAEERMSSFAAALKTFVDNWMDSRENETEHTPESEDESEE